MLARGLASSTARLKEKERIMGWLLGDGICLKCVKLFERTILSSSRVFRLSLDCERRSWEPLRGDPKDNLGRARRDSVSLWSAFGAPLRELWPNLMPSLGATLRVCFGAALGLGAATANGPDLRIIGVPGEALFPSFAKGGSCLVFSLPPSPGLVRVLRLEGAVPSSFLHFKEKGDVRMAPFGHAPAGAVVLAS